MIHNAGLTLLSFEKKVLKVPFANQGAVADVQRPVFINRVLIRQLAQPVRNYLFNIFMDKLMIKLEKDHNNNYLYPIETTVMHAHKIK